ncbi:class I SAM-dependent methyltransferase [Brevibacillus laterosporus]|uniref:class I SAM-dependent methyltransferase n=1 Tax=Brevibacillus laterosporus TaxID=1465 RepID=UPI000CE37E84|nr:class I SAM-dependent methyltransferase [Brevibacillus laterosporus]MBG9799128.1 methyltransferase [Brevibacillus laterosporus]MCR8939269.1 class I SAM-dependent methyltransferase [Brevibacillus laterosporus]MCZ0841909.1 class I SAM-dependent methyltransferase [Brevibacillus laterosporus]MCZ0846898.1 class I SAM-dependent methyltransferase [Brevibacillus laterosporus]MED1911868.1 class I SAM-dependent methyltransferase [Brevibacillus laterosporus]
MFSYYSTLCTELYDFTKPVGYSLSGDIEYYKERLKTCEGRILEAAVGSGRFLIPLLETGYTVDGIDYSPEMLKSCRKRCDERGLKPNLYEGELQNFSLSFNYGAIIIPTGSFCLIENREDSLDALKCFYKHLVPGGRLIVDLELPHDWKTGKITTSTFSLPNGDGITLENKSLEMDLLNQFTVSYLKYEKWHQGKLIQTELQRFALRWYGIEEFKLILESIGFSDITCSADYVYEKQPSNASQIITFEAVRKR